MKRRPLKKAILFLSLLIFLLGIVTPSVHAETGGLPALPEGSRGEDILSLMTPMRITEEGKLEYFDRALQAFKPTALIESHRHLIYPYAPVKQVDFFILHYDAFPNMRGDGKRGTVQNTLSNLNDGRMASIHYAVDSYPVSVEDLPGLGMGVIMGTAPSDPPYYARHIAISTSLELGIDPNSVLTADLMHSLGIESRLEGFNLDKKKDMDSVSLGVEQSGNDFSKAFPANMPPDQEIANLLSLTVAVAKRYDLQIWEIIGHNEVQQKPDPGNEYMGLVRLLLAKLYLEEPDRFPEDFLKDKPERFYEKLEAYSHATMGDAAYQKVLAYLNESVAEQPLEVAPEVLNRVIRKKPLPAIFQLY